MTYYLLVASGLWTLWLVFLDPDGRAIAAGPSRSRWRSARVLLGVAVAGMQALPFLEYIQYSPRAAAGPSGGWEYATGFAMPVEEPMTTILPQFNGVLGHYWGQNFFKLHTEYLGASVVLLAAFGIGDRSRGKLRWVAARDRRALPAGSVRRPYAVLSALVRSDADDEEGACRRDGVLPPRRW